MRGKIVLASAILAIGLFCVVPGREAAAAPGQAATRDACSGQNCKVLSLSYGLPGWKFPACVAGRYGWAIFDQDAGVQKNCSGTGAWVAMGSGAGYWADAGAGYLDGGIGYVGLLPDQYIWNPDGGRVTIATRVVSSFSGVVVNPAVRLLADSAVGGLQISPSFSFDGQQAQGSMGAIYAANQNSGGMRIGLNIVGGGPAAGAWGVGFAAGTPGTGATPTAFISAAGTVQSYAASGADAFLASTGAKFHVGAGCCDFLTGDGNSKVTANRDFATGRDLFVTGQATVSQAAGADAIVITSGAKINLGGGTLATVAGSDGGVAAEFSGALRIGGNTGARATGSWRCGFVTDGGAVVASNTRDEAITCTGCVVGADCVVALPGGALTSGLSAMCHVTDNNVITWRWSNVKTTDQTPAVGVHNARCINP